MAINTRGAGDMWLNAVLTRWQQRKKEQDAARQEQAAMDRLKMQQEFDKGQQSQRLSATAGQNALDRSADNQRAQETQLRTMRTDLGRTDSALTSQIQENQQRNMTNRTYDELGTQTGQPPAPPGTDPKTWYENLEGRDEFNRMHPAPTSTVDEGSDTHHIEKQIEDEIWKIRSQFNGTNRDDIVNQLIGLGDPEQNPYGAYLLGRLQTMDKTRFENIRQYWEQIMGSVK